MIFCVLAGILGRASMPIASNPNVTFPWVNVVVTLAGASPEDMARLVAKPIENRFLRLEGQEEVFSVSGQSYTYVRVKYDIDLPRCETVGISGISAGLAGLITAQKIINFTLSLRKETGLLTISDILIINWIYS